MKYCYFLPQGRVEVVEPPKALWRSSGDVVGVSAIRVSVAHRAARLAEARHVPAVSDFDWAAFHDRLGLPLAEDQGVEGELAVEGVFEGLPVAIALVASVEFGREVVRSARRCRA